MKPMIVTLAVFMASYIALRHIAPDGFLLYQGIALGFLAAAGLVAWQIMYSGTDLVSSFKDGLLAFFMIYAFVFTIPTTVDRSYSVRMIYRLAESGASGLSHDEINQAYLQYFVEGGGVQKRLDEQQATGTLEISGRRFVLTPLGHLFYKAFKLTSVIFACGTRD